MSRLFVFVLGMVVGAAAAVFGPSLDYYYDLHGMQSEGWLHRGSSADDSGRFAVLTRAEEDTVFSIRLYRDGRTEVDRLIIDCGESGSEPLLFAREAPDGAPYSVFAPGSIARAVIDDRCTPLTE